MPTTDVIIVRHGETFWNREARLQGHLDSPLTEEGIAQAQALGERLAREAFDFLYSSDLGRARDTAARIAARTGHPIGTDPRLRERHLGVMQSFTREEAERVHPGVWAAYKASTADWQVPGGESAAQCFARNLAAFEDLVARHAGRRIVVVAHGGVLEGMYRHVQRLPFEGPRMFRLPNASFNLFRRTEEAWSVAVWGDVSHLVREALDDL